jgi:hypothetical protein
LVDVVELWAIDLRREDGRAKPRCDLLKPRVGQPGLSARGGHALNAAAPLFDEAKGMEDATDYAVAELGDVVLEVWNCEAKRVKARVLDLEAVEDLAIVESIETPGLNPRIGKVVRTVSPEQQDPTNRRKDSEAARKSRASESRSTIGCSSYVSPRAERRSSCNISASARRLVEPTRT